jgi:hypothetical protein
MADHLRAELVVDSLIAVHRRRPEPGLIHVKLKSGSAPDQFTGSSR